MALKQAFTICACLGPNWLDTRQKPNWGMKGRNLQTLKIHQYGIIIKSEKKLEIIFFLNYKIYGEQDKHFL